MRSKCDGCPGEGIYLGRRATAMPGVRLFDAPGQKTWDFALFKEFRIRRGPPHAVPLRGVQFLNTPQFGAPEPDPRRRATFGRISSTSYQ